MLFLLSLLAPLVAAQELMRFGCSQLTIDQIDPLVEPGNVPSAHMHQVVGGNSFNASMSPASIDPPTDATCTSCTYSEDFSNYWTANVYFKAKNGTFKLVPQVVNLGLGTKAGMTIYYIRGYQASAKVTAFPKVLHHRISTRLNFADLMPGLPHARRGPHEPRCRKGPQGTLLAMRVQHAAESFWWRTLHGF